jgi:hypothetical protein
VTWGACPCASACRVQQFPDLIMVPAEGGPVAVRAFSVSKSRKTSTSGQSILIRSTAIFSLLKYAIDDKGKS